MPKQAKKGAGAAASKILKSATLLFAEQGFAAVSVRDIAAHAGVNKALVFYYYETKAGLLSAVLQTYYDAHAKALAPSDSAKDIRTRTHHLLTSYLDFIEDHHSYLRIVQYESLAKTDRLPMLQTGMRMLFAKVEELLSSVTSEGPLHVRQFYISFAGLVTTYFNTAPILESIWPGDPLSAANRRERREHLHWMMDCILDGLKVPPAPSSEKNDCIEESKKAELPHA